MCCLEKVDVKLDYALLEDEHVLFELQVIGLGMDRLAGYVDTSFLTGIKRFFENLKKKCCCENDNEKALMVITDQRMFTLEGNVIDRGCGARQFDYNMTVYPYGSLNGWNEFTHNWGQGTCGCNKYDSYSFKVGIKGADGTPFCLSFQTDSVKDPAQASALLASLNKFVTASRS